MINLKSDEEIRIMIHAGKILKNVLREASKKVKPGITTCEIDEFIDNYILSQGAEPGFKKVTGYSWASCICINEQIVHTPPSERVIKDGDIVTIDTGVFYKGLHTDSAYTVQAGVHTPEIQRFLDAGKLALSRAVKVAKKGRRIGEISLAFQHTITEAGYSIVPELTGHGVGKELHEAPFVPCFLDRAVEKTPKLEVGMTLALEVMYCTGEGRMMHEDDKWSIITVDNTPAASFEHTVAITKNGTLILT